MNKTDKGNPHIRIRHLHTGIASLSASGLTRSYKALTAYKDLCDRFIYHMDTSGYLTDDSDTLPTYSGSYRSAGLEYLEDEIIETIGYFIYPEHLFDRVVARADQNDDLNTDIFNALNSILGTASKQVAPFIQPIVDVFANRVDEGNTVAETVQLYRAVIRRM